MNGNKFLKTHISKSGLTISEVARLTGLSQGLVSMHLSTGKNKRGIGAQSAMAYHKHLGLPLEPLLDRKDISSDN